MTALRLTDLLGCSVADESGRLLGHVNDVRLHREPGPGGKDGVFVTAGLVVSDRHAGSMLGYRDGELTRPQLLAAIVRRLHRHARYVPWDDVRRLELSRRRVVVRK